MSNAAAQEVREQVRHATDIADLIGSYLEVRRQGRGFVALCPWHEDRKPSLTINPVRQSWKCWVCNVGGDVFDFVMRREGVGFRDALQQLADRAGIVVPKNRSERSEPGSVDDKNTLFAAMKWAQAQFHECLLHSNEAEPARRYLAERGITSDSIARFKIGFSPDQWQWLLQRARNTPYSEAVLEACDLVTRSERGARDRFRGRVLFPIHDTQSRPIAIGGRKLPGVGLEDSPKYINSSETRLFTKSDNLYALHLARESLSTKQRRIVVVEGYTDVVLAHQCGVSNVVAVLGTALNARHIQLLKRFMVDTVYLVLDGDEAGQRRTNEVLDLFVAAQMDLRIMTLPDQLDPADYCLANGGAAFTALLDSAVDAIEHKIRVATRGVDLVRDTHQATRALEEVLKTLAAAPIADATDVQSLREAQILQRLARQFGIEEQIVRERFKAFRHSGKAIELRSQPTDSLVSVEPIFLAHLPKKEIELLEILLLHPELASVAFGGIMVDDLQGTPTKTLYNTLQQLDEFGEPLELNSVMSALDDERLKNLVMDLDTDGQRKDALATETPAKRIDDLITHYGNQREDRQVRPVLAQFGQKGSDIEQEKLLLGQLLELERRRRGLSTPTEG